MAAYKTLRRFCARSYNQPPVVAHIINVRSLSSTFRTWQIQLTKLKNICFIIYYYNYCCINKILIIFIIITQLKFFPSHLISLGPIARDGNGPEIVVEEVEEFEYENYGETTEKPLFTAFHVAVLSALIAVSALCVTLACFLCRKPTKQ